MIISDEHRERYGRHILLPEVGEEGVAHLFESRVLIVGLGGLGSPVALYLAAAGFGTIGVMDDDKVSLSNLQRQVIHSTVGFPKANSAGYAISRLNPDVRVIVLNQRFTSENAEETFYYGWDVVVDCCDNYETRYLLNRSCMDQKIPLIHGSVSSFEGQVTTFIQGKGPCYQCLYPNDPVDMDRPRRPGGVFGVVPGTIGMLQATEAIKVTLEIGEPLVGRLLVFNALGMRFQELPITRILNCPACTMAYEGRVEKSQETLPSAVD
jgi:molybdopterin/thiamine biosynthesis adenylyltransferase